MSKEINKIKARLRNSAIKVALFDDKKLHTEFVTLEQALAAINDVIKEIKQQYVQTNSK